MYYQIIVILKNGKELYEVDSPNKNGVIKHYIEDYQMGHNLFLYCTKVQNQEVAKIIIKETEKPLQYYIPEITKSNPSLYAIMPDYVAFIKELSQPDIYPQLQKEWFKTFNSSLS